MGVMPLNLGANYCTNFTLFSESRKYVVILTQGVSSFLMYTDPTYLLFTLQIHELAGVLPKKYAAN